MGLEDDFLFLEYDLFSDRVLLLVFWGGYLKHFLSIDKTFSLYIYAIYIFHQIDMYRLYIFFWRLTTDLRVDLTRMR